MKRFLEGEWFWGNPASPHFEYYNYLGVNFIHIMAIEIHIKDLIAGKRKVNVNSRLRILHIPCLSLFIR